MKFLYAILAMAGLVAPATAQTFTPPPAASYQSPTLLVDKTPADGVIRFTTKRGGIAKNTDAKLCADYVPAHLYVSSKLTCPTIVAPPVVTPPATSEARTVMSGSEGYIWTDSMAIGVGRGGGFGTVAAAPGLVPSDKATGLLRVGIFAHAARPALHDALLQGRAVEGFVVAHRVGTNMVRRANALLTGFDQIPGTLSAEPTALAWSGMTVEKLAIDQRVTIDGDRTIIDVVLTNRSSIDISDLRYMRLLDPDQSDLYATTNEVIERGRAKAALAGGAVMLIGSDDPRATIGMAVSVPPSMDPHAVAPLPVGTKRKADDAIHVVFDIGTLAAGASTSLRIVYDGPRFVS